MALGLTKVIVPNQVERFFGSQTNRVTYQLHYEELFGTGAPSQSGEVSFDTPGPPTDAEIRTAIAAREHVAESEVMLPDDLPARIEAKAATLTDNEKPAALVEKKAADDAAAAAAIVVIP